MELYYLVIVLGMFWLGADAIMWTQAPNTQRCLKEELHANVLVAGEYDVTEAPGQRIDYIIKDSKNHILSQRESITKGKFTFVTETYDVFEVCFISKVPQERRGVSQDVTLDIKIGIEAKNYEGHRDSSGAAGSAASPPLRNKGQAPREPQRLRLVAEGDQKAEAAEIGEAAKLKPMELELKRLEDLSEAIVQDFTFMRKREEEMRDTNESTNNRVLFFSIFSMVCLLGLATWQVLYLRRYFKAKKLIE